MQTEKEKLPKCYIFDVDSTLALRTEGGRSPFDWNRVDEDIINPPVHAIYQALRMHDDETAFFIFTGRDEYCRSKTEQWLNANNYFNNGVFMRPDGDKRRDTDIKLEHYRNSIERKYQVLAVFENQARCVELFRNHLGLTVLQVADGKY